jgi:uncharacterized protein YraI
LKFRLIPLLLFLAAFAILPTLAQSGVTAEAVGQANVRATTDVNATLITQIQAGTRYPVLGRSAFYPWLLLGNPTNNQPLGWVFQDLLNVQGDINSLPVSELVIGAAPPTATLAAPQTTLLTTPTVAASPAPGSTLQPTTAPTVQSSVIGLVAGEINIRYGPGTEYPRIGVGQAGEQFPIIGWHTQLPWVQISYPQSPNGIGWVAIELLEIQGDLYSLPATSQTSFALPTLTPTPSPIEAVAPFEASPVPLSPGFQALGEQIFALMLQGGFDPQTSKFGAFFLMDLRTGEALTFGDDIAFSGMSLNKIGILATYFGRFNSPLREEQAYIVAEAMICSENISTNEMLAAIGDGNPYTGAERVSAFLEQLGLRRTFIYTPYANDPFITPQAPRTRTTDANQTSAIPDPFNQMTVSEMGSLLDSMYQCAYNETGPLLSNFSDQFNPAECRQMLNTMSYNRIGSFIEMGTPLDVRVAHKHGWIADTHGDAALVFSPGGDYILIMALRGPDTLLFGESSVVIEETSRLVYNYFNPTTPLEEVRAATTESATCNLLGSPAIESLIRADVVTP